MKRALAAALVALTLLAGVAGARPAHADEAAPGLAPRSEAREHYQRGKALQAARAFDEAIREYEAGYALVPMPEFLFNIGQCHRNLGSFDEAIFSFRKYLRLKPDAENREATEELINELEAEKARSGSRPVRPRVEPIPDGKPAVRTPASKPIYTRWWFWTGVVVVAGAATTAVVLSSPDSGLPGTDLGNLDFSR